MFETSEDAILRAGLAGEKKALEAVSAGLNEKCHVFTNLIVPYEGRTSETDLIAVTPSGITIIEVKNYSGIICGDLADDQLIKRKVLRNGSVQDSEADNPVSQVAKHVYRVAGYLREAGVQVHVNSCVLFVDEDSQLQLTDRTGISRDKCPVFHIGSIGQLHRALHSARVQLDQQMLEAVVSALDRLIPEAGPLDDEDYDIY